MSDTLKQDGPYRSMAEAPKDGRLVIGELADGKRCLMRWRSQAQTIEEDCPDDQARTSYWARWHTDTGVEPVRWAATLLEEGDVLRRA